MNNKAMASEQTRLRLLDAAVTVFRTKGYAGSTVDDICLQAGLTKGSFFHHFASKEELGVAAAEHFASRADQLFAAAPFTTVEDPLARLLGYIDFRMQILRGEISQFTCLLGTMVQESYNTNPAIRQACDQYISEHASMVGKYIAAAKEKYAPAATWDPAELGLYTQAVIQGAFILAKAKQDAEIAARCLAHLKRYLEALFEPHHLKGKSS